MTLIESAHFLHDLRGGVLVFGTDGPGQPSKGALKVVADSLVRAASSIDHLDVELALEFNWSPLIRSLQSAVAVVKEANHPKIGILFDPAHYHTTVVRAP